jgi:hypothetical protein
MQNAGGTFCRPPLPEHIHCRLSYPRSSQAGAFYFRLVPSFLRSVAYFSQLWRDIPAGRGIARHFLIDRQYETVPKFLSERKASHDILSPGNKLPVYYPASLRDNKDLSPVGVIDSSPVASATG